MQLVPPSRVDLVDEMMARIGRRRVDPGLGWPPLWLVCELDWRVKRGPRRRHAATGESQAGVGDEQVPDALVQLRVHDHLDQVAGARAGGAGDIDGEVGGGPGRAGAVGVLVDVVEGAGQFDGLPVATLLLEPGENDAGLFAVFDQVFQSLWERSKPR